MYAVGIECVQKNPCQNLLKNVSQKKPFMNFCSNSEVLQEILHRYNSIKQNEKAIILVNMIRSLNILIFPVEEIDLFHAQKILSTFNLSTRDCVHLGLMESRGI